MRSRSLLWLSLAVATPLQAAEPAAAAAPEHDAAATPIPHDPAAFRPDPSYGENDYDASAQLDIYGAKHANITQRPLLEQGREMYGAGPLQTTRSAPGAKNPSQPQLIAHGDFQLAAGWNKLGNNDFSRAAPRLNLDVDYRFTATERLHAFVRPLDRGGKFTRFDYADGSGKFSSELDGNLDALFFEGDLGPIAAGVRGKASRHDRPFALGLMPLLFQNGVWLEDAFTGIAAALPARNSHRLDISNFDVTLFVGLDRVDGAPFIGRRDPRIYGLASFIEANRGYWEFDYGYTADRGAGDDRSYHNAAVAFTRRYFNRLSNTVRLIGNFGQKKPAVGERSADGLLVLIENSWVTRKPSTLVPYANFFVGFDHPQSLARDPGAGGILKNTGLLFEGNELTGMQALDASAHNTWGGAFGLEYLFGLDRQLVVEIAALQTMQGPATRIAQDDQYGLGLRYQQKLCHNMLLRFDALIASRGDEDDLAGVRGEWRIKF